VSGLVGMLLHTALLKAGHEACDSYDTRYDTASNDIVVRFHYGTKSGGKYVCFSVPAHLFDPVEYAQAKWPEWFVKCGPVQLDLFKQE
jgi:hypothetical protein